MPSLPQKMKDHLDAGALAMLTTLFPAGSPQTTPVWATYDGDDILISTVEGRQKDRNLKRDDRVSVLVMDPTSPWSWTSVTGRATVTKDPDSLIDHLSHTYTGQPYTGDDGTDNVRLVVRIKADRVLGQ